jgi:glutamate-1-semialdehyde 2,1-aminomutase
MQLALLIAASLLAVLVTFLVVRFLLTRLITLRAAALTPAVSRHLARWVKSRDYSVDEFFDADGAGEAWTEIRRRGLQQLSARLKDACPRSLEWGDAIRESFSDLRFTDANRVPFPFVRVMRERFNLATVVTASNGPRLRDLDGRWSLDVSGSYGLNVAGFDRYKQWIEDGWARVKDLGPVLGPLHPLVGENITMLKAMSGLDDVSFHMSGTEAVMAAVRLARFNTRRTLIVCFAGAYHGWWDGVLPGLGNERSIDDCLTLKDLDPASLAVIRRRAGEIAGVLVNPVQSFHPNSPPPNDAILLTSKARQTNESTDAYQEWLHQLRRVCSEAGVPLIFDEVYTGFRLARGGGQEYFGIQADMVVYGKTVAGGLPIGVVCGRKPLMRRFDPDHPMRLAYVVGTFSAHPAVMGAMCEFLKWVSEPEAGARYEEMNGRCDAWVQATNRQLVAEGLPLRIVHLGTIWTVLFKEPGRYNWLLQYYLRAQGVTLSWVGTGRCLTSMDFTAEDYGALQQAILGAARQMQEDGWLLTAQHYPERERRMRLRFVREMMGSLLQVPKPVKEFYTEVMRRKKDDHHASHNNKANQYLHLLSSSAFIYCYAVLFSDLTTAMFLGVAALFVRQIGHAVLEPPCHDEEETLLGYNTRNKTLIFIGYLAIPASHLLRASTWSLDVFMGLAPTIARQWFLWTVAVVLGRVLYLVWKHSFRLSMVWYAKLMSDPVTDIIAYFPRPAERA